MSDLYRRQDDEQPLLDRCLNEKDTQDGCISYADHKEDACEVVAEHSSHLDTQRLQVRSADTSQPFIPAIEGLRGIAVTLAMYCHIDPDRYILREVAGSMGVTIFFVLSGFLITAVLMRLHEKRSSAFSYVPRFYADRFFRLGPGMMTMVALASFAHWYLDHDMNRITRYAILTLTYTSNVSTFWTDGTGPFGNTWSLACEEQFYIIWSLLLPLILARGTQIRSVIVTSLVILLIAMQAWIGMFDLWQMNWRFGFWSNVWKMLFGASLRLISIPEWVKKRSTSYIGLVGFISILLLAYQDQPSYDHIAKGWKEAIRPTLLWADFLTATSTSLILCSVSAPKGGNWLLEGSLVRFLGRVSYAWYLWQVPILELIGWKRGWLGFWSTAVAFCIAMISTIYIEEPINIGWKNWKHRRDQKRESASPA